jgi:hypothetical protein
MKLLPGMAIDRVADQLTGTTQNAVSEVLRRRGPAIARAAERLRDQHPGLPPRELADKAISRRSEVMAMTGAASALPGLVPIAGTAVELGAAVGDITLLTLSQVELVLLIAALYHRSLDDVEPRRLEVLLALGVEAGVVKLRRDGEVEIMRRRYAPGELRGDGVERLASRVNRELAGQVIRRLARRRAGIVLGREIPVVGIGIAAGFNLRSTRRVGRSAITLFEHLS